jgi:hypothetical protein
MELALCALHAWRQRWGSFAEVQSRIAAFGSASSEKVTCIIVYPLALQRNKCGRCASCSIYSSSPNVTTGCRVSDESVGTVIDAEMGLVGPLRLLFRRVLVVSRHIQSCVCPSAFHLRCLVNRAKSHCNVAVNPFNFICPLHPNASICIQ